MYLQSQQAMLVMIQRRERDLKWGGAIITLGQSMGCKRLKINKERRYKKKEDIKMERGGQARL